MILMTVEPKASASTILETATDPEPKRISLRLPTGWLDEDAGKVLRRLQGFDFSTYLVGGCVRDLLVGRYPKDFDVATQAHPNEVKRAFSNCRLIGRRFRLAHILFRNNIIEVATFRKDPNQGLESLDEELKGKEAEDLLIRSDNVFGSPADDAFRRDFTINALYYDNINQQVLDYVGGYDDIQQRIVRTIGDPARRFKEDPIRMLRAIKFSSRLGFDIEEQTWKAMKKLASELRKAAVPRIQEELFRMLRGGYTERSFQLMSQSGLMKYILPEHQRQLRWEMDGQVLWVPPEPEKEIEDEASADTEAADEALDGAKDADGTTDTVNESAANPSGGDSDRAITEAAELSTVDHGSSAAEAIEKAAGAEAIEKAPSAEASTEALRESSGDSEPTPIEASGETLAETETAAASDEACTDGRNAGGDVAEGEGIPESDEDSSPAGEGATEADGESSGEGEAAQPEALPRFHDHRRLESPVRAPIPSGYIQKEAPEHSLFLPALDGQKGMIPLPSLSATLFAFDMIGDNLPNHIYLALLSLYPAAQNFTHDPHGRPADQVLHYCIEWLESVGAEFRLARRDRELARLSLMGFLRMLFRKDQRRATSGLARKSYFLDATALYGIYALALGDGADLYYRLLSRCDYGHPLNPVTEALEKRFGPRPKSNNNRQRRGRGHRRRRRPSR